MTDEIIFIKDIPLGLKPGEVLIVDGSPYIYTGKRGFTDYTPIAPVSAVDTCAAASEILGLNPPSSITPPVKDYCKSVEIPVDDDLIYITPYEEISKGSKIFINGRGYVKTGDTGTVTHILSAMPLTAYPNDICN